MGYLVKDWTLAIKEHYRPPPAPPTDPTRTFTPQPSHLSTFMVDELWKLWLTIWNTRTTIILGGDDRATRIQDSRDIERIMYFKNNHTTELRKCDWKFASFPAASLTNWKRRKKKDLLRRLERLHALFVKERVSLLPGQRTLSSWLQPASNPT